MKKMAVDESKRDLWIESQGRLAQIRQPSGQGPLNPPGGSGTLIPVADDHLKSRVDFLQTAFLWLAGIMITGFIAMVTVMLNVSSSANARSDKIVETMSGLNREVGVVGGKVDESNRRLSSIENKLDQIGGSLSKR